MTTPLWQNENERSLERTYQHVLYKSLNKEGWALLLIFKYLIVELGIYIAHLEMP